MLQEKLKLKQIKLKKSIEDYSEAKKRSAKDMDKNKEEKRNRLGICEDANLKITINSILFDKNYFRSEPKSFVIVNCEGKEFNTLLKEDTYEPVWNEMFEFPITFLEQSIEVMVRDRSNIIGKKSILLKQFKDQTKIEEIYSLFNEEGKEFGKLIIKGHLLWSLYAFHKTIFDKAVMRIAEFENELEMLQKYCSLIENPFGILLCGEIENILTNKLHEINQIDLASSRKSFYPGRASVLPQFRNIVLGSTDDSRKKCKENSKIYLSIYTQFFH